MVRATWSSTLHRMPPPPPPLVITSLTSHFCMSSDRVKWERLFSQEVFPSSVWEHCGGRCEHYEKQGDLMYQSICVRMNGLLLPERFILSLSEIKVLTRTMISSSGPTFWWNSLGFFTNSPRFLFYRSIHSWEEF